jgi:hypothetical protein
MRMAACQKSWANNLAAVLSQPILHSKRQRRTHQSHPTNNRELMTAVPPSKPGMDEIERAAIRAEAVYDPAVLAALDRVRAELAAFGRSNFGCE